MGDDDPQLVAEADGTINTVRREEVTVVAPADGNYTVLVHHFNDRQSMDPVEAELSLRFDDDEVALPLEPRSLVQGEVWQAFQITYPGPSVTALDQVTTHEALGGPVVNARHVEGD